MKRIKVLQIGLGPLGQKMIKYLSEREGFDLVGVVDINTDFAGRDVGGFCCIDKYSGITVSSDIKTAVKKEKPDVALITTVSSLEKLILQVENVARYGMNIISTCEELTYPFIVQPELSKRLDEVAKANDISIIGTGVNPGFMMDYLPIALTGACQKVESIKISRIQDASSRRLPFQKKIGAGLTLEEFEARKKAGSLGHVGLTESMGMIADRMGWMLNKCEDIITPVIAEEDFRTEKNEIKKGIVLGVQQIGKGYINGKEIITLIFRASLEEKNPVDSIEIKGTPDIISTIPGGVNGDIATCAITINTVRSISGLAAGLKTMVDIPVVSYFDID